ncbi:hypothetical protein RRG08_000821 [Elysia crispata]|uniref:Uncharacterized protein n=1 Tax=Elysia crispata TaxID=231223 RepID=A0AAE1B0Z6_9GAST|nr:hypothetical protein RRG08_000821 [Elysia crispata]
MFSSADSERNLPVKKINQTRFNVTLVRLTTDNLASFSGIWTTSKERSKVVETCDPQLSGKEICPSERGPFSLGERLSVRGQGERQTGSEGRSNNQRRVKDRTTEFKRKRWKQSGRETEYVRYGRGGPPTRLGERHVTGNRIMC